MGDTIALEAEPAVAPAGTGPAEVGLAQVASAALGVTVLGAAVALGTGAVDLTLRVTPLLVIPAVGAAVLTTPALLVAHQFLAVGSPVTNLAEAIARATARVGQIGWGFAPVTLLFAVTAPGSWPLLFVLNALTLGVVGLSSAAVGLRAADRDPRWALAVVGWCALTLLVAARLLFYLLPE